MRHSESLAWKAVQTEARLARLEPVVARVVHRYRAAEAELVEVDERGPVPGAPDALVHLPSDGRLADPGRAAQPEDRAGRVDRSRLPVR